MKSFWYDGHNVGDNMTRYILKGMYGEEPTHVGMNVSGKVLMSGSILHAACEGDTLLGTGSFEEMPGGWTVPKNIECKFVRGPGTAKHLARSDLLLGDAGLLMPCFYTPKDTRVEYDYGVVPHYTDAISMLAVPENMLLIDTSLHVTKFIDQLVRCRNVISSSLHGIVLAEAYGVPAIRMATLDSRDRIRAFDFKHSDYYEGTCRELPLAVSIEDALTAVGEHVDLGAQTKRLYNTLKEIL